MRKGFVRPYNGPSIRFVPAKGIEQQDIQSVDRIRSQQVSRRIAQANQIRGLLLEYGIVLLKGIATVRKAISEILEDVEYILTSLFRELLSELYDEVVHLDDRIDRLEQKLKTICVQSKDCQRPLTMLGGSYMLP